ncbi:MAG: hypothetical protein PHT96_13485 [Syntrophorhabdaceae bacterium]|nr:hypothetical protein [Syntrophorhabdaceae bacterium]MDD4197396.1 hypothetical protein [Syntrophorhabdaceae bacterium]
MIWVYIKKAGDIIGIRVKCPFCRKEVIIIRFGSVSLAACCAQMIYFNKDE